MARKKVVLNAFTVFQITKGAKSRKQALATLEGMLTQVGQRMADAVRNQKEFSGSSQENIYFLYLQEVRRLIDRRWRIRKSRKRVAKVSIPEE